MTKTVDDFQLINTNSVKKKKMLSIQPGTAHTKLRCRAAGVQSGKCGQASTFSHHTLLTDQQKTLDHISRSYNVFNNPFANFSIQPLQKRTLLHDTMGEA